MYEKLIHFLCKTPKQTGQDKRREDKWVVKSVHLPQMMSNNRDVSPPTQQTLAGEQNRTFDGNEPLGRSSNHYDFPGQKSNLICYSHDGHNTH